MSRTKKEPKKTNSKIVKYILYVLLGVFVVGVCIFGYLIYRIKQEWTPKQYTNREDVEKYIKSDYVLKKYWETIQTYTAMGKIQKMEFKTAVLMGGASLYVKCFFTEKDVQSIKKKLSQYKQEKIHNGKYSEIHYILSGGVGGGARLSIHVDEKEPGIVHFYAYAGDG